MDRSGAPVCAGQVPGQKDALLGSGEGAWL